MKKLILAVDNNKFLTLAAIALGVFADIFGTATGWLAALVGILTGSAFLALKPICRSYKETWTSDYGKRWMLLSGMAITSSILWGSVGDALCNLIIGPVNSLAIFVVMVAVLLSTATAWTLLKMARENYSLSDRGINLIIWAAFLGVIGLMATGCYALTHWMVFGASITDLLHDNIVIYGGCGSLGLIAVFSIVLLFCILAFLWDKAVTWAKR